MFQTSEVEFLSQGPPPLPPARAFPFPISPNFGSKTLKKFDLMLSSSWEPFWTRLGPIFGPILGSKLAHLGIILASCRGLIFGLVSKATFGPFRARLGVHFGSKHRPKTWEGCLFSTISAFGVGPHIGTLAGTILARFGGPSWAQNCSQEGSRNVLKNDSRKGHLKDARRAQHGPQDPLQEAP